MNLRLKKNIDNHITLSPPNPSDSPTSNPLYAPATQSQIEGLFFIIVSTSIAALFLGTQWAAHYGGECLVEKSCLLPNRDSKRPGSRFAFLEPFPVTCFVQLVTPSTTWPKIYSDLDPQCIKPWDQRCHFPVVAGNALTDRQRNVSSNAPTMSQCDLVNDHD